MRLALFRADASIAIGSGHIMRCLVLADGLKAHGYTSIFICRKIDGHLGNYINDRGYQVKWIHRIGAEHDLEEDLVATTRILRQLDTIIEWLIVDHYDLDVNWEERIRPYVNRILVIDDLANRVHDCDLLVDQNVYESMKFRYLKKVPKHCRQILGPQALLLRHSFYQTRKELKKRSGTFKRLLIFFGGSDPTSETNKAIEALSNWRGQLFHADVVIGTANPRLVEIMQMCQQKNNISLHIQIDNMAELIASADFALGAGGISMWERCFLGLPSAVVAVAPNQCEGIEYATNAGAIWNLGTHEQTCPSTYSSVICRAIMNPHDLNTMEEKALAIVESQTGRTESLIIEAMLKYEQ